MAITKRRLSVALVVCQCGRTVACVPQGQGYHTTHHKTYSKCWCTGRWFASVATVRAAATDEEMERRIPWEERVVMLSIHPDAATRDDVARLASSLREEGRDD